MSDDLPTPRSTLASRLRVLVRCTACRHPADWVVTNGYDPQPWRLEPG